MSKYLLIDDNEMQHELFRCYCIGTGHEFLHAVSLEQALEILENEVPEVVFLDNRLAPYPDFRKTVPAIRDAGFEGKIVVISSDVQDPVFNEAGEYTVHDYINKFEVSLTNFSDTIERFRETGEPARVSASH